tara:strand:+ start:910 stop:1131 length:222 start_codon:yes stop_codon:yes gene_type:complete
MTYSRDNIDVTYSKMLRYKRELTCRLERKLTKKEFSTAIGIDQEYLEKTIKTLNPKYLLEDFLKRHQKFEKRI